jgi:3-mercaptopyruvate sulfurtransferase SseA
MHSKDTTIPFTFRRDLYRWQHLVSPAWVATLITGGSVTAAPAKQWRLLETGFGAMDAYAQAHIPGARYIDTSEFEKGPLWNKVADRVLVDLLLSHGIRHDTTVILYGRNPLAAARLAHLMLYFGVKDVRLIDGGYAAWTDLALPLKQGFPAPFPAAGDFGAAYPANPQYLVDTPQARGVLEQPDACLVSIRTWKEFVGQTSGYSYIPAKGEIAGALWGRSGSDEDVNSMSEFHDAHGRMLAAAEICRMWRAKGIRPDKKTVFYCGTGWRASLAFFYAWLMNWERISVYDGGWCEWSRDPRNPVVRRLSSTPARFKPHLEQEPVESPAPYSPIRHQTRG